MVDPVISDASPCVGCGLCCNGVLHWGAKAAPGEVDLLRLRGHEITEVSGRKYFTQPCIHESDRCCSIYLDRYKVCRTYRCALLRRYEAGEITLESAQLQIKRAYGLHEAVSSVDPEAGFFAGRKRLRAALASELKGDSPDAPGDVAPRLLNLIALDFYLDRWFRNKDADGIE